MTGKPSHGEQETVGYIVSAVRKQSVMNAKCPACFLHSAKSETPEQGIGLGAFKVHLPASINL